MEEAQRFIVCENHLVKQVKTNSELYQTDKWRIQAEEKTENRRSENKRKMVRRFPVGDANQFFP